MTFKLRNTFGYLSNRMVGCLCLLFWCFQPTSNAGDDTALFEVKSLSYEEDSGMLSLEFPNSPDSYYVLYQGLNPGELTNPIWINLSAQDLDTESVQFPTSINPSNFFKIVRRNISSLADTDGDGMSDVFELNNNSFLDPFNAADAWDNTQGSFFIIDRPEFEFLSERENFPGATDVREVKFLIDAVGSNSPRIYFMNTSEFSFHYDFAYFSLGRKMSLSTFNALTYFRFDGRQYLAGSIIAHDNYLGDSETPGLYTFEFWPSDPVPYQYVQIAWDLINAAMPYARGHLAYHAAGETQMDLFVMQQDLFNASDIVSITSQDLFGNVTYSALNPGETYGRLKLVDGTTTTSIRDIVIFKSIPNKLSHVSGIITQVPQTPLSHINLKAKQNNTPNAYIKDASTHPELLPFLDKFVHFTVGPDGFEIEEATQQQVDDFLEDLRPPNPQFPNRNLSRKDIKKLSNFRFNYSNSYGAKAANLAEMRRFLPSTLLPDGYGVPFYFYDEFMKANGFYEEVETMLADPMFAADPDYRKTTLDTFRNKIRDEGALPTWMRDELDDMHTSFPSGTSLRCRSSTNNEDLPGFNGAGLYNSYTHKPEEGHIEKSMKQVWASLWTFRAFEERDFHRIDHLTAAMGVLVHPNYKNEQANGVAVTKNIYDPDWRGYYVNVQIGEDLVTNPDNESVPEEFLVASLAGEEEYEIQYIRFSNQVPQGQKVLSKSQILELADVMQVIQSRFRVLYNIPSDDLSFAMDIEFKITANGVLNIKQARPWID